MNLINDPWIPIQRTSGKQDLIAPWQISDKEIVSISSPRVDFDGALIQFLIGLLQTTMTPTDADQWYDLLKSPPSLDKLKSAFKSKTHAFETQGKQTRFMQDYDPLDSKGHPISKLLMDAPGDNTLKKNTDHFVKRGRVKCLCTACASTALFTLQSNAPAGGRGHRTSMRGGGPLTTLVVNDCKNTGLTDNLWTNLWLNVLDKETNQRITGAWDKTEDKHIFPWLAPTQTSEKTTGKEVFPEDTHPYQMYWSMPRRIRILWNETVAGHCDLCDTESESLVTHYETKNYGINYSGAWVHPLSPHSVNQKTGEILPKHAQPGGITYRHWLGLISPYDETNKPALVVSRYQEIISNYDPDEKEQLRLYTFGYDMDKKMKMKARCWYESTFPLYELEGANGVELTNRIEILTTTATDVAGMVRSCIKDAWFRRPGDARGDTAFLQHAFFQHTEKDFYQAVKSLIKLYQSGNNTQDKELLNHWHSTLRSSAYKLFDYWSDNGDFAQSDPRRIAKAHTKLRKLLHSKKLLGTLLVSTRKKETP